VQDYGDSIDMNPSGGDVCGHQGLYTARRKFIKSSRSLILSSVAMDGRNPYVETAQLLRESICPMACFTEDQSRRDTFQDICRNPQPILSWYRPKEVARGRYVWRLTTDGVLYRISLISLSKLGNFVVQRR